MKRILVLMMLVLASCGGGGGGGEDPPQHDPALIGTWTTVWFASPVFMSSYVSWVETLELRADGTYTMDVAYDTGAAAETQITTGTWATLPPQGTDPNESPGNPILYGKSLTSVFNGGPQTIGYGDFTMQYELDVIDDDLVMSLGSWPDPLLPTLEFQGLQGRDQMNMAKPLP